MFSLGKVEALLDGRFDTGFLGFPDLLKVFRHYVGQDFASDRVLHGYFGKFSHFGILLKTSHERRDDSTRRTLTDDLEVFEKLFALVLVELEMEKLDFHFLMLWSEKDLLC